MAQEIQRRTPSVRAEHLIFSKIASVMAITLFFSSSSVSANGFGEDRAWQFRSSSDRVNLSIVADMIEKRKGGYYDGFTTIVYSTTNIGTQINCNTVADATGNIADGSLAGNSPYATSSADLSSDSVGNASNDGASDTGVGTNSSSETTSQNNAGNVGSGVLGSSVVSGVGPIQNGGTVNELLNTQANTGDQTAGVENSNACEMGGSTFTGDVTYPPDVDPSNAVPDTLPPLN